MPSVTVHHDDGSTESIPTTTGWELKETIGEMWRQRITVERALANGISLETKADEVELDGYRRGVLADIETGGATWTLVVYSPEWYATLTEPIAGGTRRTGTDKQLIEGLIAEVPEWSAGTIAELTGGMSFVFNHAFAHEALRRIEKNAPGELVFEDDGTVNYVAERGSDRTGSVTLSAANGNIEDRIRIQQRGRKLDATHVRVVGAFEGEAQYFANLVPDDDPASYENRVDYQTDRWAPGDERDWDRWQNKDVLDQATIEEEAATLGGELDESFVEAKTTAAGVSPRLTAGDRVTVQKDDADLNRGVRVHKVTTKSAGDSVAATVQDVTLSTRTVARQDVGADRRDLQRFNTAFQGDSVVLNTGGGEQPVDADHDYEMGLYYPDEVKYEHRVNLRVQAGRYAAPVGKTAYQNTRMWDVPLRERGTVSIGVSGVWDAFSQNTTTGLPYFTDFGHDYQISLKVRAPNATTPQEAWFRVYDNLDGTAYPRKEVMLGNDAVVLDFHALGNVGDIFEYGLEFQYPNSGAFADIEYELQIDDLGANEHQPFPGIKDDFGDIDNAYGNVQAIYGPSDCDVFVNGVEVETGLFPSNIVAFDTREAETGASDWSPVAIQNAGNVTSSDDNDILRIETNTASGDPRAEGVYYWEDVPPESWAPLTAITHVNFDAENTTLETDTDTDTSGVAITVHEDPSVSLADTPAAQVLTTDTDSGGGEDEVDNPFGAAGDSDAPIANLRDTDLKLKYHVFGADGDDCILRIRYVEPQFNYGYNPPHDHAVDLEGVLEQGEFNTVRITSDSLGQLKGNLDADVYRQILGGG